MRLHGPYSKPVDISSGFYTYPNIMIRSNFPISCSSSGVTVYGAYGSKMIGALWTIIEISKILHIYSRQITSFGIEMIHVSHIPKLKNAKFH